MYCFVSFFNPDSCAVGTSSYCLAKYQDAGWNDNPELQPHATSLVEKITMIVLARLLAKQLEGSGFEEAMDATRTIPCGNILGRGSSGHGRSQPLLEQCS